MLKHKRGKLLSVWWIVILALTGVSVGAGVWYFYSSSIDLRSFEAQVLYDKIADCIIEDGYLVPEVLQDNFDIYGFCDLDKKLFTPDGYFFFKVDVSKISGKSSIFSGGNVGFEDACEIAKKTTAKRYPSCKDVEEKVLYYSGGVKISSVRIITASNQEVARV